MPKSFDSRIILPLFLTICILILIIFLVFPKTEQAVQNTSISSQDISEFKNIQVVQNNPKPIIPSKLNFSSTIPIIVIHKLENKTYNDSKRLWSQADFYYLKNETSSLEDTPDLSTLAGIKLRGNTALSWPKKSYNIEAWDAEGEDKNIEPFGMPKESDWVLVATYDYDKSHIRHALAYALAGDIGLLAMRTKLVEVFVSNDSELSPEDYMGVYTFAEKIKRDKNRVDIEKMQKNATTYPDIGGGWLVKLDHIEPGEEYFNISWGCYDGHILFEYPKQEDLNQEQKDWIESFFKKMLLALKFDKDYLSDFVDMESFAKHYLLNELARNADIMWASTYMYIPESQGTLHFGPEWDFDRAFNAPPVSTEGWGAEHFGTFDELFKDDNRELASGLWKNLRQDSFSESNINATITNLTKGLPEPAARDYLRWYPGVNMSFDEQISNITTWLEGRLLWMDMKIIGNKSA